MEREIRQQMIRMAAVVVAVIVMLSWQYEFMHKGFEANPWLNGGMFVVFGFASILAFRSVFLLRDDVAALNALKTDFGASRPSDDDIYKTSAKIFREPELLGHAYRLITEELCDRGKLTLATDTVHILVASVESRISERKSTIMYFSGLMVFLGLFGTFIGLMETVAGVSGILAGLNFGGTTGADAAFGDLITGLKAPLAGMSTGFSASLFGLGTSLVLGVFERFSTAASRAVKIEFEGWLTNLSSLDAHSSSGTQDDGIARPIDRANLITARRLARLEAQTSQTGVLLQSVTRTLGELTTGIQALSSSVSTMASEREGIKTAERDEVQSLMDQQRALTSNAANFVTALADERAASGIQLHEIRRNLERLADHSVRQSDHMAAGSWATDMLDVPLMDAGTTGAPSTIGARGLIARLTERFGHTAGRGGTSSQVHAPMLAKALGQMIVQQDRMQQVVQDIDMRRERDNQISRAALAMQEQMLATLLALTERLAQMKEPENVSRPLDELRKGFQQQHLALDIALRRLELQLQQTQDMTHEAVATAREAVDVVTYKRAING
jgi:hypothetical protein